jgi:hypothetical protein
MYVYRTVLYSNRLWRIVTMVYAVQNYKVYFGLYPSSGVYKTKDHNVSETGSASFLRWMGPDRPTQLGPLEWARSILPHPPEEGDRSSLRNVVIFCLIYTKRWIKSKINLIVLYSIIRRFCLRDGTFTSYLSDPGLDSFSWFSSAYTGKFGTVP